MIENPGVCDPKCFTLIGASMADTCVDPSKEPYLIGKFGSGTKNSIALLLRENLNPKVFVSNLKLSFSVEKETLKDALSSKDCDIICVEYSGKTDDGKNKSGREKFSYTTDFGKHIWDDPCLALREFVSNAIDFSIRQFGNWDDVVIKPVDESQVRAKNGYTRVFVPMNQSVYNFYLNLGRWFLHFSEPESLLKSVLEKKDRNFSKNKKNAVIYRRGVFIREFERDNEDSMFDYNLNDIPLDEARKSTDWDVQHYSAIALSRCQDSKIILTFLSNFDKDYFEYNFSEYSFGTWTKDETWKKEFEKLYEDAVLCLPTEDDLLKRKGFKTVVVSDKQFTLLKSKNIRTHLDVLSEDERAGIIYIDPTQEMIVMLDKVWSFLERLNLTQCKSKPSLQAYIDPNSSKGTMWGYQLGNSVYIKDSCSGTHLFKVMLEELTHYITNTHDYTREFQDYLLDIIFSLSGHNFVAPEQLPNINKDKDLELIVQNYF